MVHHSHNGRQRYYCKDCGGGVWNLRARSSALSVQGVRWVWNLRARSSAKTDARSAVVNRSSALKSSLCGAKNFLC